MTSMYPMATPMATLQEAASRSASAGAAAPTRDRPARWSVAHQDVQSVGVDFGVPAVQAGHGQAACAVRGDHDHEHRDTAREPGGAAHVSLPRVADARNPALRITAAGQSPARGGARWPVEWLHRGAVLS